MIIAKIFLLFIIYSFIGWLLEVIDYVRCFKKFVNRGFLIGPLCPIYGFGGVIMTYTLSQYYGHPITLFVMTMFICAILEYVTSYVMEKLFNARWWDYSKYKFNINGRICLEMMIPFGICGLVVIYLAAPFFDKILAYFNDTTLCIMAIIIAILFVFDILLSAKIINKFKNTSMKFNNKDNTEEITKKVKEELLKESSFSRRLIEAFPNVKAVFRNIKNELTKTRFDLKITKKELKKVTKKLNKTEKQLEKEKRKHQ